MKSVFVLVVIGLIKANCWNDEYCAKCKTSSSCSFCWNAFLTNGICTAVSYPINDCLSYSVDGFCRVCKLGYYVNMAGRCNEQPQDGCAEYAIMGDCKYCKDQMKVVNGTCVPSSRCSVEHCLYCNTFDACEQCQQNYYLTQDGKCALSSELVGHMGMDPMSMHDYCEVRTHSECMRCMHGYHDRDGNCVQSSAYNTTASDFRLEWVAFLINLLLFW